MTGRSKIPAGWAVAAAACAALCLAPGLTVVRSVRAAPQAAPPVASQAAPVAVAPPPAPSNLYGGLSYRPLSVFTRGGRVTAVAGVPANQQTYYMGSTGGGVWRTADAGVTWSNVSDGYFEAGSIGAIAVSESDANVIYVGTGSACPRGNVSPGVGMYKSTDAGRTWQHIGLRDSGAIGRIVIHPTNPDLVYVAVLGNLFGPSPDRGVYRSRDGGRNWERVYHVSDRTGAVDITMDVKNPNVLIAAMWTVDRKPWSIDSGSVEGGIFKSTDAGTTWTKLSGGLPANVMTGKIAVSISRANPQRVYALVEAGGNLGGVYRSDDQGGTWTRTNTTRALQQRAFYYTHIFADPVDADTVYAQNVGFSRSTDGGKTFVTVNTPHSDNHDLWINPLNNKAMIEGNDGGANVSLNAGQSWSTENNQPTAEIYRLEIDTRWPYWVYGAQQDNSTIAVPSQGTDTPYDVGGGESGYIAVDPRDYNVIYAGNYGGTISRTDRKAGVTESIRVYADMQTGQRASDMKYRFQWNAPIRMSPYDPDVVYTTSQVVHRTRDGGVNWEVISPDLTRNDKRRQDYSGGEGITRDSTGVEVYATIFAFEESKKVRGLLWAGSDDGLVHISRDNGKTWKNITPPGLPEGCVNVIDLSAHNPGRAHIAVYRYRQNDFRPYIYQTNDYGATWKRLADGTNGIPANHFVRVVREDTARKGLLYAGTEFGIYASFDDGAHWQSIQANLPRTPVTDLMLYRDDLIVATQGRGFYIVDNLSVMRSVNSVGSQSPFEGAAKLFTPEPAYREGVQPPTFYYWFRETPAAPVTVEVKDATGKVVFTTTSQPGTPSPPPNAGRGGGRGGRGGGGGGAPAVEGGETATVTGPPARGQAPAGAGAATGATPPAEPGAQRGAGGAGAGGGRGGRGGAPGANAPAAGAVQGMNNAVWASPRMAPLYTVPPGIVMWGGGGGQGPKYPAGAYSVTVRSGSWSETQNFRLNTDPRFTPIMTDAESAEQFKLANEIGSQIKSLYDNLARIRDVKKQAADLAQKAGANSPVTAASKLLTEKLVSIEGDLTQLQGEGGQDALNFPGRMDNQLIALYQNIAGTERHIGTTIRERYKDLKPQADQLMLRATTALKTDIAAFNAVATGAGLDGIK